MKNYIIYTGKPIKLTIDEAKRVRAKCKPPCERLVYASIIKNDGNGLVVKTLVDARAHRMPCGRHRGWVALPHYHQKVHLVHVYPLPLHFHHLSSHMLSKSSSAMFSIISPSFSSPAPICSTSGLLLGIVSVSSTFLL